MMFRLDPVNINAIWTYKWVFWMEYPAFVQVQTYLDRKKASLWQQSLRPFVEAVCTDLPHVYQQHASSSTTDNYLAITLRRCRWRHAVLTPWSKKSFPLLWRLSWGVHTHSFVKDVIKPRDECKGTWFGLLYLSTNLSGPCFVWQRSEGGPLLFGLL